MAKPPPRREKSASASPRVDSTQPKRDRTSSNLGDIFASDLPNPNADGIVELDDASLEDDDATPAEVSPTSGLPDAERASRDSLEPDPRRVPDSLVPVRMSELVDSTDGGALDSSIVRKNRLRAFGTNVGAFAAGALVVVLARPLTVSEPPPAACADSPRSAAVKAVSPGKTPHPPQAKFVSESGSKALSGAPAPSAQPVASASVAPDGAALGVASASASASPPAPKKRKPVRRAKKPYQEYRPPTAAFPD